MLPSYVVLDLETTGGRATGDAITEIAAVRIDGGVETARWSTLVNPGTPIPYFIESLTGISDAMVQDAPRFKQVADELLALLQGSVLVAHNASFDHGFLRSEFARVGHDLRVPSLCTVRLSRRLYPQYRSHGLDAIMQRHGLHTDARHRAMGDVDMVLAWLAQARAQLGAAALQDAALNLLQPPLGLPVELETHLADLPDGPGAYLLHGDRGEVLRVGSAARLRERVTAWLQAPGSSARERGIASNTRRISWQPAAGEIGAQLLATRLTAQHAPRFSKSSLVAANIDPRALHPWPHTGAIAVREYDEAGDRTEVHLFRQWRHVATVDSDEGLQEALASSHLADLDMDLYRLLCKRLLGAGRLEAGVTCI